MNPTRLSVDGLLHLQTLAGKYTTQSTPAQALEIVREAESYFKEHPPTVAHAADPWAKLLTGMAQVNQAFAIVFGDSWWSGTCRPENLHVVTSSGLPSEPIHLSIIYGGFGLLPHLDGSFHFHYVGEDGLPAEKSLSLFLLPDNSRTSREVEEELSFERLAAALNHSDPVFRENAARKLGLLRDPRAVELLIPLIGLDLDQYSLSKSARQALVAIGPPAEPSLLAAMNNMDDRRTAFKAAGALEEIRRLQR